MRRPLLLLLAAASATPWLLPPRPAFSHEVVTTTVLFDREIVRILNRKCVACHTEGNLAFPLLTYEQTRPWARSIEEEALRRHMPPWRAVRGYGEFANDNSLTSRELAFIVSWVEGNGPKSAGQTVVTDIAATPRTSVPGATAPDLTRWQLGQPDLVVPLPGDARPPSPPGPQRPSSPLSQVLRTVVPIEVPAGRSIGALEFKPADRRTITAAFFYVQETGQWLGSWTPWYNVASAPAGAAYVLPPRSHIVAELHYRGQAAPSATVGSLGLSYSRDTRAARLSDLVLHATGTVPAHRAGHEFRAAATLAADTYAVALWPRLLPGAQALEVSAKTPGGGTEVLLYLKDVLPEWPTPYIFKTPVLLPKATQVVVTVTSTNAAETPQTGGVTLTINRYRRTKDPERNNGAKSGR